MTSRTVARCAIGALLTIMVVACSACAGGNKQDGITTAAYWEPALSSSKALSELCQVSMRTAVKMRAGLLDVQDKLEITRDVPFALGAVWASTMRWDPVPAHAELRSSILDYRNQLADINRRWEVGLLSDAKVVDQLSPSCPEIDALSQAVLREALDNGVALEDVRLLLDELPVPAGLFSYVESFDNFGSTWKSRTANSTRWIVGKGVLSAHVPPGMTVWTATRTAGFGDGIWEVDATQVGGSPNSNYGLAFRLDPDADDYYLFVVDTLGYVASGICLNRCEEDGPHLFFDGGWLRSEAVERGRGVTHRLRVVAIESRMTFYVNDVEVGSVNKESQLTRGDVGLLVSAYAGFGKQWDTIVEFDNLRFTPLIFLREDQAQLPQTFSQ